MARGLLHLGMSAQSAGEAEMFSFLRYMECTTPFNDADAFVGCFCVVWSADDEVDHTVWSLRASKPWKIMRIWEWLEVEPLNSLWETSNVVPAYFGIELFTSQLNCPRHRFYIIGCVEVDVRRHRTEVIQMGNIKEKCLLQRQQHCKRL